MDDRKFARYAFLIVAAVAIVGMLSAGGNQTAVGKATNIPMPAALEAAMDKCVPQHDDVSLDKAEKYCECVYLYGGDEDCAKHLA